jgi:hypothetical protein
MATVSIDIDLPPGVEITAYERHGDGHGFEVTWPWPERCCCPCCGWEDQARLEVTNRVRVVRDLDILDLPSVVAPLCQVQASPRCPAALQT